jgi:chemotaxis methyl-accepting protein methylase
MPITLLGANDREWLAKVFAFINETRGIDFSLYRHATMIRKVDLRISETRSDTYRGYLAYLKSHPEELDLLIKAVSIQVSKFFRNPLVYELLDTFVVPELMTEFGFLKAWSLGCANGEEPYSLAMIARELLRGGRSADVRILGTDISSSAIEKASGGTYNEGDLSEVKKKYLDAYFNPVPRLSDARQGQERLFRVSTEVKSMVNLECADMLIRLKLSRDKGVRYNLICCRNVLIYMSKVLQSEVIGLINDALYDNGYLVIGEVEMIPVAARASLIQPFPGIKIFKKKSFPRLTEHDPA